MGCRPAIFSACDSVQHLGRLLQECADRLADRWSPAAARSRQGGGAGSPLGAALLIGMLAAAGQRPVYLPGHALAHAAGGYRGENKTDARDAAIIAGQARMRRGLQPLRPRD